jgi:hypothetical protein
MREKILLIVYLSLREHFNPTASASVGIGGAIIGEQNDKKCSRRTAPSLKNESPFPAKTNRYFPRGWRNANCSANTKT